MKNNKKITDYMSKKSIPAVQKSKVYKRPLSYIPANKKNPKKKEDYHDSSREASIVQSNGTEKIDSAEINNKPLVCHQLIMIGPSDMRYFHHQQSKLKKILENYNQQSVLNYIMENAKFMRAENLNNIKKIDDEQFWIHTMPMMIQYAADEEKQDSISSCIEMLVPNENKIVVLSRAQILMILINIFLCSFPTQSNRNRLTLSFLMQQRPADNVQLISFRRQKLKCILDYFKKALKIKYSDLEKQFVQIQRVCSQTGIRQITEIQYGLKDVMILKGNVEDQAGQDIIVDFANKSIGGGALGNGGVQEEILFITFTQLIATMAITFQIEANEAIIIYGAKKWTQGIGYSKQFRWVHEKKQKHIQKPHPNIIVAIDASDYSRTICKGKSQYTTKDIHRQIIKALTGFQGVQYGAGKQMAISTGRWGCGAFKGDIYLKFLLQWIAASIAGRDIKYMAQEEQEAKQLKTLVKFLKDFKTTEVLQSILQFHRFAKEDKHLEFLTYFKRNLV